MPAGRQHRSDAIHSSRPAINRMSASSYPTPNIISEKYHKVNRSFDGFVLCTTMKNALTIVIWQGHCYAFYCYVAMLFALLADRPCMIISMYRQESAHIPFHRPVSHLHSATHSVGALPARSLRARQRRCCVCFAHRIQFQCAVLVAP